GAVMPVWYLTSLILVAVWAIAGWHHHGTGLVVTAGALLILSVIMSILLLVPINNRGKTCTPDNRPADWKQQMNRWDRLHHVRVAVIIAAFTLLVAAVTSGEPAHRSRPDTRPGRFGWIVRSPAPGAVG
ncbi:anthrone oxygenase family protein, partial [Streptomyces sp. NPDC001219]